ncbi:Tubby-like F-box protein 2 [Raphanus sativus]|nr:Tubby-like F-box protein 2 [Raphanus sativus]
MATANALSSASVFCSSRQGKMSGGSQQRRVEESESAWPARAAVVSCASVCKSWRGITVEIVGIPEQCGKLTFPISLKQPGPRDLLIQCLIKRNRATATYILYYGLMPCE